MALSLSFPTNEMREFLAKVSKTKYLNPHYFLYRIMQVPSPCTVLPTVHGRPKALPDHNNTLCSRLNLSFLKGPNCYVFINSPNFECFEKHHF